MRLGQRGSQLRIWARENLKQGVVLRAQDGRQEDVAVCAEAAERSHEMKTDVTAGFGDVASTDDLNG